MSILSLFLVMCILIIHQSQQAIYRCRGVARTTSEQRFDAGFTYNIDWPSMEVMDDIEKASLQTFIQLRDSGTSLRASPQLRPPHVKDVHQPLESAYPPESGDQTTYHRLQSILHPQRHQSQHQRHQAWQLQDIASIRHRHPVQSSTCKSTTRTGTSP